MRNLLLTLGLGLIAAWLILQLAAELPGMIQVTWERNLLVSGVVLLAAGLVASLAGRRRTRLRSGGCVRCGKPVRSGQIYCAEHIRDAMQHTHSEQRNGKTYKL